MKTQMSTIVTLLIAVLAGVGLAGFMAGQSDKRKNILLWSAGGVLWSLTGGTAVFFMKSAVREIALRRMPGIEKVHNMLPEIAIPDALMVHFGVWTVVSAFIVFLLVFNCRRNSVRWYWAILWISGLLLFFNSIVFMPYCYGLAAWLTFAGIQDKDIFQPVNSHLLTFYLMWFFALTAVAAWTFHTCKAAKHSWKNILVFTGICTVLLSLLWLSAWGMSAWADGTVDRKAAELGITPCRVENTPGKNPELYKFYTRHPKYNPPRSGRYNWRKNEIPSDEKEYTMKFFDSPELENHLGLLTKNIEHLRRKDVLYLSTLQDFRSLVRHRADKAELYFRSGKTEKVLPELLKYPELEKLIPDDTFLISELVRTATRHLWVAALVQFAPDGKQYADTYRRLLKWSFSWRIHLPHEAGLCLGMPVETSANAAVRFFYAPYRKALRYRVFFDALDRIPELEKLQKQETFSGNDIYSKAAANQQQMIALGRTAFALKLYRAEQGEYPAELAELVPKYLPRVYCSGGKELSYTVKDGDFTLSSGRRSVSSRR